MAAQAVAGRRIVAPQRGFQRFPADDTGTLAHQRFEQLEAGRVEAQRLAGAAGPPGVEIEHQVGNLQALAGATRAAQDRLDARIEFGQRERLDQIVVGTAAQTLQAIIERVAGSEHDHRHLAAGFAQAAAELVAIHAGQHDVEDDQVVMPGQRQMQSARPVARAIDDMTGGFEVVDDVGEDVRVVFDDQQTHALETSVCRGGKYSDGG